VALRGMGVLPLVVAVDAPACEMRDAVVSLPARGAPARVLCVYWSHDWAPACGDRHDVRARAIGGARAEGDGPGNEACDGAVVPGVQP